MGKTELVRNAMLATIRYPWEHGVCMQAVYELGDITTAVAMAHDAVKRQQADGRLSVINENYAVTDPAANGEMVYRAYEITGKTFYLDAARKMLNYLMKEAPRTDTGIFCHNEISFWEEFSPDQIWVDSIYMAPPFLAVMGETEEAVRQIEGMYEYLIDPVSGILRHIYDAGQKRFQRDKLWMTGNGWALLGMARVMETALREGRQDLAERLQNLFIPLLDHLLRYQLEDGRFHDIVDDPDTFIDGAGAMMMAAAIYRSCVNGWLDQKYLVYADKVLGTMDHYVDEYGILHEVCGCPDFLSEGTSAESMAAYLMMHGWKKKLIKE